MEMTVVGFDPYFTADSALDGKVKLVRDFDEFLRQIDVITFHVPGGEGTKHLLNRERLFNVAKPNLLVVNDARGEVVDEFALAEALKEKRMAGAALDVFVKEPPAAGPPAVRAGQRGADAALGRQTDEAQTAVSVEACKAIVAYLQSGEIRGAVNAGGIKLDLPPDELPFTKLAGRIGALLAGLCESGYKTITLRASGTRAPKHMNTLLRLATVELLKPHLGEGAVNVINVEHLARGRGIEVVSIHEPQPPAGLVGDIVGVRVDGPGGESHRILGTVYADGLPRVLRIDGYSMDMIPEGNMVLIQNQDQPGVIGLVGSSFGDAKVNIADMVISRAFDKEGKATALMVIKTDSTPTDALLSGLRSRPNILKVKSVVLPRGGRSAAVGAAVSTGREPHGHAHTGFRRASGGSRVRPAGGPLAEVRSVSTEGVEGADPDTRRAAFQLDLPNRRQRTPPPPPFSSGPFAMHPPIVNRGRDIAHVRLSPPSHHGPIAFPAHERTRSAHRSVAGGRKTGRGRQSRGLAARQTAAPGRPLPAAVRGRSGAGVGRDGRQDRDAEGGTIGPRGRTFASHSRDA